MMKAPTQHKNSISNKIAGTIEILVSGFWSFHNAQTFYNYQAHPEVLWAFMLPEWFLAFNFFSGLIGIWSGVKIWQSQWRIKQGYLVLIGLWLTGEIVYLLTGLL